MNRLPMFVRLWKISRCKNLQILGITAEVIVVIGQKWIINEVWFLESGLWKICRKFCRNLSTTGCKGNTFSRMLLNMRKQCLNQHDAVPLLKVFPLFYGQRFEFQTTVHNAA